MESMRERSELIRKIPAVRTFGDPVPLLRDCACPEPVALARVETFATFPGIS